MIEVTTEDLYAEACRALGEAIVRERIITAELRRRDQDVAPAEDA